MSVLRAPAERVLAADRIAKTPIVLKEETAGSKCDDTAVNHKAGIYIYDAPCGEDLYLEGVLYCPARA